MALPKTLTSPPPPVPDVLVSFPAPHILLITLNRPKQLNSLPSSLHAPLAALYDWYDEQPSLRCAVLTGAGRAFCAGADLKEWHGRGDPSSSSSSSSSGSGSGSGSGNETTPRSIQSPAGFGGLSNRPGRKPVVAAVNGLAFGGGMEMVVNCDLVLAARGRARFGLPEVTKGVVALAGALLRLPGIVGRQRAAEMALLGRIGYGADEMREWGVVNFVVPEGGDVVAEAVKVAEEVSGNSPDAVMVSREGLRLAMEGGPPERSTQVLADGWYGRIDGGENMREGLKSFVERRQAVWRDSKL
jgi:enoyl-CoA hydratase/carnithine racemase